MRRAALFIVACTLAVTCPAVVAPGVAGAQWSLQPIPLPAGASSSELNGISCPTPQECTAVGYYQTSTGGHALAERRDAAGWQMQPTPELAGTADGFLKSVSCATAGD